MTGRCTNCENILEESYQYCPQCGQKTNLHRLNLHYVLHGTFHYFTHADKGFLQLLRELTLRNGTVAREYVAGKRAKYFPPLNFYLLVATIFVLVISIVTPAKPADVLKENPQIANIKDIVQREKVLKIYERKDKAIRLLNKYSNILAMIAVPLICFIYWLFYARERYNYTEHLTACMYMVGFANFVYVMIFVPFSLLIQIGYGNPSLLIVTAFMVFQVIYNSFFYYRFINKQSKSSALKAFTVSFLVILFWFSLSTLLVRLYITSGFWGVLA